MQTTVVVDPSTSYADAVALCVSIGACGYWLGIPPQWADVAEAQAWTLPCSVDIDEQGTPVAWSPLPAP